MTRTVPTAVTTSVAADEPMPDVERSRSVPSTMVAAVGTRTVRNGRATVSTGSPISLATRNQRTTVASTATATKPTATPPSPQRTATAVVATVPASTTTE